MNSYYLRQCVCCGSGDLRCILDLGEQPLANGYSAIPNEVSATYPLALNLCGNCWHAQLSYCVDRRALFDSYTYVSNTSNTLNEYFRWFSHALAARYPRDSSVLEIAANDGSLIGKLMEVGFACIGIDPAGNIVSEARKRELPIVCGYWPEEEERIHAEFDIIVALNVIGHVDNPLPFVCACKRKLRAGGIIILQPSQARMFANCEFDTCYHEHISFFNTRSMQVIAKAAGLILLDSAIVAVHGDSPLYILCDPSRKPMYNLNRIFREGAFSVSETLIEYERNNGIFEQDTYEQFSSRAREVLSELRRVIEEHRRSGFMIVFVGAAAKAMTVMNGGKIVPDRILDENPRKIGLYVPGANLPIESLNAAGSLSGPALFVITAWNFRNELVDKLRKIGVNEKSLFYSYFPKPQYL